MTVTCSQCRRTFVSKDALYDHCFDKTDHHYCDDCERLFVTDEVLQHSDSDESDTESEESDDSEDDDQTHCASCKRMFVCKEALYQHLIASSAHNWCFLCSKDFQSAQALSEVANNTCPLCPRVFKAPSSIAHHIEKGGCNSQITRHHVTAAIHALKIHPTISIARRIKGSSPTAVNVTTTYSYSATELALNRRTGEYECYICRHGFGTLVSLNTHLASAAHDAKQFKCPHKTCRRKFTLISALIQHIESEACGLAKFRTVEDFAHSLTSQFTKMLKL
ncbi:hypothetical protein BDZ89DRAFT_1102270 [Hymenopellis radicata]|nr:hypothetical protein BDZ89DRAFT_1102270 [Hymenopellis radicata]